MSSANPAPYRPERPRSIFGPIVLVAVGIILLLATTGRISLHSFGWWFSHYWPIILIFWGVAKLAEYIWAKQKGYPPPRLGAGSIVFLVFFILFGITTTRLSGVDWAGWPGVINDSGIDGFDFFGTGYDFTDNFAVPVPDATQIKILANRATINVAPSQDNQAHFIIHKTLHSDSESGANRMNENTRPKFQQQGTLWVLDMTGGDYDSGRFNVDLQLPRKPALSVSTHVGDVSVSGRGGSVDASSEHGNLSAEDVTGSISMHLKHGNLTVSQVTGDVTVDGTITDSNFSDVGGLINLNGTYWGTMQMSHIAKPVHFVSTRTDLQFTRLDGDFNMEPDDLRASGIVGPFRLVTRSKGVHLEDVSGDIHIDDRNASVEVSSKGSPGNIDVANVHGEIDLSLPATAGFQLDAQSVGGDIQSDFDVSIDNKGNTATARGSVGKGGAAIRLKADHGTIQIKKQ
ncbi:MAG TPA: DUF4097 family beta strand repeat-containing protein [Terriglobales bacterium]